MTRFFTDPKSGASYAFGDKLPSADFNAYLAGWRNFDAALDLVQANNWGQIGTVAAATGVFVAFDQTLRMAFGAYTSGGNPKVALAFDHHTWSSGISLTAGVGLTVRDVAASGSGVVVVGGLPGSASTVKVHSTDDGFNWTPRNTTTGGTSEVKTLYWDTRSGLFVAGLGPATTTTALETSADGQTWTNRTVPTANSISSIAGDGSTIVVAFYNASTNAFAYSTDDCVTWAAGSLPSTATWSLVAWCEGQGIFLASDTSGGVLTSLNGVNWTAVTSPTWPNGATPSVAKVAATHNEFLMAVGDTYGTWVLSSTDGGSTWKRVCNIDPTGAFQANDIYHAGGYAITANSGGEVFSGIRVDI